MPRRSRAGSCAGLRGVLRRGDLVEHAARREVLLLRDFPAAEVTDVDQLDLRELRAVFLEHRRVARPVEMARGDLLTFGCVQEFQVGLRQRVRSVT